MRNIKIGPKLTISFLFIAALTAFLGIYLIDTLEILDEETDFLYEKGAVPLGMLVKTAEQVQELRIDIRRWQLAKTDESRTNLVNDMNQTHIKAKELIDKQKVLVINESGKKFFDDLTAAIDKYMMEVHNYVIKARIDSVTGLSIEDLPLAVLNAAGEMSRALDTLIEIKVSSTEKVSKGISERTNSDKKVAITLLAAVLIISIGFGLLLTLSITRPLHAVVNAISKMEKGDMTVRADLKRGDELGILSKALDSLSVKLHTILKNLQQTSDTLAGSAEELSSIGRQVTSATEQVNLNINAMASGAEQASTNANDVAGTAEQMSTNMNTMAAAVEELSASINQISNNASDANKIADEATVKSREATGAMNKLGAAAKEIGHVTEVIKRIADKTSLLALNATIEAASAGEAGKGFAVVAGEIKELANQSTKSADDIARRIESIQSNTSEAVTVINEVSEIIKKINQSVDVISSHVDQQTKASNEISSNVAQVNVGAKRVASAISEVAKGSKDMSRGASEVAKNSISAENTRQINQGADELARLASDLKTILSQFKV
ncbi:MAG: methyl-accepting chemotaxis protein [Fibromonadaceae bacterium]|jgi:methyl-accepting chemotaxis protein|nr:methyl-accepting chemotaxis protein [Fibromonadaceae bacterium]